MAHVVEIELAFGHAGRELLGLFLVDVGDGFFHQADDVAHAEDAAGDALRVEDFNASVSPTPMS